MESPLFFWLPLFTVFFVNVIYFQWSKTQADGDFFGEYDERRN